MRKHVLFLCCLWLLTWSLACARKATEEVPPDPHPGTPEAAAMGERYMRSMSDTLARSQAFTFQTHERLEVVAPGGEKRAAHFTRKATIRRPNALFFELQGRGDAPFHVAAFYDGQTVSLHEIPDGPWAQTPVPATLDEMLDDVALRFGLPVPVGDVIYSSPYDAFLGSNTRGGFVGRETISGVPCVKLDYADEVVQVKLWLPASGPALPRRLELVYKKSPVPLTQHMDFSDWKLDVPVADQTFAFQRPAGRRPVKFGDFVAGISSRTIPAAPQAAAPGAKPEAAPAAKQTVE
jgi:hypothetical protein